MHNLKIKFTPFSFTGSSNLIKINNTLRKQLLLIFFLIYRLKS